LPTWADREFRLEVFKLLQKEQMIPTGEREQQRIMSTRTGLKDHSPEELNRALEQLQAEDYARPRDKTYEILAKGRDTPPHAYLYGLAKGDHEKTKAAISRYERRSLGWIVLLLGLVFGGGVLFSILSPSFLLPVFFVLIFGVMVVAIYQASSSFATEGRPLNEKRLGTKLFDAYQALVKDDRENVKRILKAVSKRLQRGWSGLLWETLNCDRTRLAELGSNLERIVIPEVSEDECSKDDLSEVLVRIACLLFDATPESIQRAVAEPQPEPSVYGNLPMPQKVKKLPASLRRRIGVGLRSFIGLFVIFETVLLAGYIGLAYVMGWKPLGEPMQYIGLAGASFTVLVAAIAFETRLGKSIGRQT
jgi:hypothetical protein